MYLLWFEAPPDAEFRNCSYGLQLKNLLGEILWFEEPPDSLWKQIGQFIWFEAR